MLRRARQGSPEDISKLMVRGTIRSGPAVLTVPQSSAIEDKSEAHFYMRPLHLVRKHAPPGLACVGRETIRRRPSLHVHDKSTSRQLSDPQPMERMSTGRNVIPSRYENGSNVYIRRSPTVPSLP